MKPSGPLPRRGRRRITAGNDKAYLDWIRTQSCAVALTTAHAWRSPAPPTEAHHIRSRNLSGQDRGNVIPLCRACNAMWHTMGRQSFQQWANLNAVELAQQYAGQYERERSG